MYSEKKALVVVYKDEVLLNFVRKLVETNDDKENEVVGTKDGTVDIVAWTEKVYADNKKAGKIQNKTLFLGNIKDIKNLIPVLDIKFDRYGVKYGFAGRQAVVFSDPSVLKKKEEYEVFLNDLKELPVPQKFKKPKSGVTPKTVASEITNVSTPTDAAVTAASIALAATGPASLLSVLGLGPAVLSNVFKDKKLLEQQMMLYGILNLYNNDLENFIKS